MTIPKELVRLLSTTALDVVAEEMSRRGDGADIGIVLSDMIDQWAHQSKPLQDASPLTDAPFHVRIEMESSHTIEHIELDVVQMDWSSSSFLWIKRSNQTEELFPAHRIHRVIF